MMIARTPKSILACGFLCLVLGLAGCSKAEPTPTQTPTPAGTATPTLPPPTPTNTHVPLALKVNDSGISISEFEAELTRYLSRQEEKGVEVTNEDARQTVQDDFINQLLLAQGAASEGFVLSEAALQTRLDALAEQAGGADALATWQERHGYTDESFRVALRRQAEAAWMRDKIIASVPSTAEQVHIQQILLYNQEDAQEVLDALDAGKEFPELAAEYDQVTKGELGWFPRGYLTEQGIEEAAFALQPGQYSGIVKSDVGYHILFLAEVEADHPLSPDALLSFQNQALADWLLEQRSQSTINLTP